MRNALGLSVVALLLVAAPLAGQERRRVVAPRGDNPELRVHVAGSPRSAELSTVERVLRERERLELTEQQVSQLEELRRQALERWIANTLEQEEIQSRLRAGYDEDAAGERLGALADARRADAEETRERIDEILTEQQRETLRRRSRAVVAPRGGVERVPEVRMLVRPPRAPRAPEARRAPMPPAALREVPAPPLPRVRRWL